MAKRKGGTPSGRLSRRPWAAPGAGLAYRSTSQVSEKAREETASVPGWSPPI